MPLSLALHAALAASVAAAQAPSEPGFNRDIRPILAERCFTCHGPEPGSRKAGLRLDRREDALSDRAGRRAFVPGDPAASEALRRVASLDPAVVMPPPDAGPPLSERERELLRLWVKRGAAYEPHWSYVLPRRPETPGPAGTHPVDAFIDRELARRGLTASPPADPATLRRRLAHDLTGLPPDEDGAPGATDALVDRLLASPHYGERMATMWLDWVRYADTLGMHLDQDVVRHPYRDYVVSAFNRNLPFDRFTVEQLAGDLLPGAGREQRIASGYNRLNPFTTEGGVQPKDYLARYAADRVANVSTAWLGSTLQCAQCHDHKYDPFTQGDFYSMAAYFADLEERAGYFDGDYRPEEPVPADPRQAEALARLDRAAAELARTFETPTAALGAEQAAWEARQRAALAPEAWRVLWPESLSSESGTRFETLPDGSVLATGPNPDSDAYAAEFKLGRVPVTGLRLEALTHETLTGGALSRESGNFALTELEASLLVPGEPPAAVRFSSATADYSQAGWPVEKALDGDPTTGWSVDGRHLRANRRAYFTLAEPLPARPDAVLRVRLVHRSRIPRHQIGRFRLSATALPTPGLSVNRHVWLPRLVDSLMKDAARRAPHESAGLAAFFRRQEAASLARPRARLAELERKRAALTAAWAKTPVSRATEPRETRVLRRGDWMDTGGPVALPRPPALFPEPPSAGHRATRLDLARWLVSKENPLTARVFVNRVWAAFFGAGLVRSADDFGARGDMPSHPELLDWLAVDFAEGGYDVKRLVRLIVGSAAYRRSSIPSPGAAAADPDNRWLSRQNSFRGGAEWVRDVSLAVSGLLEARLGGPSVRLYQPTGFADSARLVKEGEDPAAAPPEAPRARGRELYRRTLYAHWKRALLNPELSAFDAPARDTGGSVRPRSTTPLQALVLLNSPTHVEAARAFAARILERADGERMSWAFRRALGREPTAAEAGVLDSLLKKHAREFARDPKAAEALLAVGDSPAPRRAERAELASWTSVARVLLSLHEAHVRR